MSQVVPTEDEVLEGVVIEHEGRPVYPDPGPVRHWWGFDGSERQTSAHFILHKDGTIQQAVYPQERAWQ